MYAIGRRASTQYTVLYGTHCAKNNLNLCIKTETAGADETLYMSGCCLHISGTEARHRTLHQHKPEEILFYAEIEITSRTV